MMPTHVAGFYKSRRYLGLYLMDDFGNAVGMSPRMLGQARVFAFGRAHGY